MALNESLCKNLKYICQGFCETQTNFIDVKIILGPLGHYKILALKNKVDFVDVKAQEIKK